MKFSYSFIIKWGVFSFLMFLVYLWMSISGYRYSGSATPMSFREAINFLAANPILGVVIPLISGFILAKWFKW